MGWLLRMLYNIIVSVFDSPILSAYAMALIIATVLFKLVLMPLTLKQTKSMKVMQDLNPKLQELQKKYSKDPQTLQRKQLELYKEANYSPFSGCLPMLIQMPILIAFFYVIRNPEFAFNDFGEYVKVVLSNGGEYLRVILENGNPVSMVHEGTEYVKIAAKYLIENGSFVTETINNVEYIKLIGGDMLQSSMVLMDPAYVTDVFVNAKNIQDLWFWTEQVNRSFLWIKDLSLLSNQVFVPGDVERYMISADLIGKVNGLSMGGLSIPFIGGALPILAAISGYSTYLVSKMTTAAQPQMAGSEQQQSTMNMMNAMMPVMIFVFSLQFPSGLALYWVITNLWQVAQQWVILNSSKKAKEV